jgi:hypothetical protein
MVKKKAKPRQEDPKSPFGTQETDDTPDFKPSFCLCFGQLHKLVTNCQSCGKVICEKERSDDCLFCHQPLNRLEQTDLIDNPYFEKAIADKQRLLDFQDGREASKNIIDDQSDWYDLKHNLWESKEVREKADDEEARMLKQKAEQERHLTFDIDFQLGTAVGKEVVGSVGAEKEHVRAFLSKVEEQEQQKKDREITKSVEQDSTLQTVITSLKEALQAKGKQVREGKEAPPPFSHQRVVQNDDAFAVLSEYGRAMSRGTTQEQPKTSNIGGQPIN